MNRNVVRFPSLLHVCAVLFTISFLAIPAPDSFADCGVLDNLIGWTLLDASEVDRANLKKVADGESDVASLKNGMVFRFPREQSLVGHDRYKELAGTGYFARETVDVFVFVMPPRHELIEDARRHGVKIEDVQKYDLDVP